MRDTPVWSLTSCRGSAEHEHRGGGYGIVGVLPATEQAMAGYSMSRDEYLNRLRRIEGQVRGLQRMVSEDQYCIDILTQVSSVKKALQGVAVGLLDEHVRHCVMEAAAQGDDSKVSEATAAIERLIRS